MVAGCDYAKADQLTVELLERDHFLPCISTSLLENARTVTIITSAPVHCCAMSLAVAHRHFPTFPDAAQEWLLTQALFPQWQRLMCTHWSVLFEWGVARRTFACVQCNWMSRLLTWRAFWVVCLRGHGCLTTRMGYACISPSGRRVMWCVFHQLVQTAMIVPVYGSFPWRPLFDEELWTSSRSTSLRSFGFKGSSESVYLRLLVQ